MARQKKVEVENQLKDTELQACDGGQSKRENEMIDLLKQLINQNEQIIQLLTKLKERFI